MARVIMLVGGLLGLILCIFGSGAAYLRGPIQEGKIARGVHAAGVDLSGLAPAAAQSRLKDSLAALDKAVVVVRADGREQRLTAATLGARWSIEPAVERSMEVGREAGLITSLTSLSLAAWHGRDFAVPVNVRRAVLAAGLRPLERASNVPAHNAGLVLGDAEAGMAGGVTITPSHAGTRLDMAGSAHAIAHALVANPMGGEQPIELPMCTVKPSITEKMLSAIDGEVAEFTTHYKPWQRDRTHNLFLASSAINGAIIAPGHLFSYNRRVGQRKISKGYRAAPIFVKGKVVEDTGGGICQVATTVYNAALMARCSVVERYHHSAHTSYIGPGRDATVSWGSLDLKFRNTRPEPILLTTSMGGGTLTVKVWGKVHPGESVGIVTHELPDGVVTYRIIHEPDGSVHHQFISSDPYQENAE